MEGETTVQLEREPLESATSEGMKSDDGSEREKEMVAVSPALRESRSDERAMVGGVVSGTVVLMVRVSVLSASSAS